MTRETTEEVLNHLEASVPELAQAAFAQAYWQALAAGSSVLISEGCVIYEVFPDGTRKAVKTIAPPISTKVGEKLIIS